jgi:hypothetical protein
MQKNPAKSAKLPTLRVRCFYQNYAFITVPYFSFPLVFWTETSSEKYMFPHSYLDE